MNEYLQDWHNRGVPPHEILTGLSRKPEGQPATPTRPEQIAPEQLAKVGGAVTDLEVSQAAAA